MTPSLSKGLLFKTLQTPLGEMVAAGDEEALFYLGFKDSPSLERDLQKIEIFYEKKKKTRPLQETVNPFTLLQKELGAYFEGTLQHFTVPIQFIGGTSFQQKAWETLLQIPYGQTKSYKEQSHTMQKEGASRAVGSANGKNPFVVLVPCHRIIASDGSLGGYSAGLHRKKWLLNHEKTHLKINRIT